MMAFIRSRMSTIVASRVNKGAVPTSPAVQGTWGLPPCLLSPVLSKGDDIVRIDDNNGVSAGKREPWKCHLH